MVEPDDDHGATNQHEPAGDVEFELEPVLLHAAETMRLKSMELIQATQVMRRDFQADAVNLDGCVALRPASNVKRPRRLRLLAPRRMILQERERLAHNVAKMQHAKALFENFTHEIKDAITTPERQRTVHPAA